MSPAPLPASVTARRVSLPGAALALALGLASCAPPEAVARRPLSAPSIPDTAWPPDGGGACPTDAAGAGGDCALTLEAAIRLALERNVELYNQRQQRREQRLQLEIATNPWRPEFTTTVNTDANHNDITGYDVTGSTSLTTTIKVPSGGNAELTLTQPLYGDDGESQTLSFNQPLLKGAGREIAEQPVRQARLAERKNILGFRDSVAGVVNEVITAYRGLGGAIRQVEISADSLERAQEQRATTQALIRAGRVAAREAGRSDSAIANGELALVRARNGLDRAQSTLRDLLELDDEVRLRPLDALRAEPAASPDPETPDLGDVLARRTDHLIAVMAVEEAEMGLVKAGNDRLPNIGLLVRKPFGEELSLGVTANFPLSDGKKRKLDLLKARNGLDRARRALAKTRKTIRRELRRAVDDVVVNRRLVELARASRELARDNLGVERTKFAQGLSSAADLAAAERELAAAEESENDALVDVLNALDGLDKATGRTLERWGIAVETLEP